jgi:hypothetical protein
MLFFDFLSFGILKCYIIKDQKIVQAIQAKMPKSRSIITDDKPQGIIWGWPYIGIIKLQKNDRVEELHVHMITTESYFKQISAVTVVKQVEHNDVIEKNITNTLIKVYSPHNAGMRYVHRSFDTSHYIPYPKQEIILNEIITKYTESKYKKTFTVYISGTPGSGKSTIAIILAKMLANLRGAKTASYCKKFNPTKYGNSIDELYDYIVPTSTNILVLVFEEVDILLNKIHNGILVEKYSPDQVYDKATWNSFMDDFSIGLYPYLILIMTSNVHIEEIHKLDPAYLREGRLDIMFDMDNM